MDSRPPTLLLLLLIAQLFSFISAQQCSTQTLCANNLCCSQYGYCGSTSDYCGSGCQSGPCTGGSGGSPPSTPSGSGVSSIITSSIFDQFLSQRSASGCPSNGFYTYDAFVAATATYGTFGTSGGSDVAKQELAAFFANVAHETGSGCYVEEINKADYCQASAQWSCASGKQYYGRGPLQLTWNYNYGAAGQAIGFDGINNPDIVAQDATTSFKAALWFWMTQQSPTCHDAMVNNQGFGKTIQAINGGLECGSGANLPEQQDRINLYTSFCSILGVQPGSNLSC